MQLNAELCAHVYHGLVWLLVPFIPASGVFVMVGFVLAERTLYLPSIGYCIGLAAALEGAAR